MHARWTAPIFMQSVILPNQQFLRTCQSIYFLTIKCEKLPTQRWMQPSFDREAKRREFYEERGEWADLFEGLALGQQ